MAQDPAATSALLRRAAEADCDVVAHAVAGGPELTYAEWHGRSDRFARGLLALGVLPGSRVVLDFGLEDWVNIAVAYVGCQKAEAVPLVPLPGLDDRSMLRTIVGNGAIAVVGAPRAALHRRCYRWPFETVLVAGSMAVPLPATGAVELAQPSSVAQRSTVLHSVPHGCEPARSLLIDPLSPSRPVSVIAAAGVGAADFLELITTEVNDVVVTPSMAAALVEAAADVSRDWVESVTITPGRCRSRVLDALRSLFPQAMVTAPSAKAGSEEHLAPIEDALMDHPDVAQAGVASLPNAVGEEELWAAVVPRRELNLRVLLDDMEQTLGTARAPRVIQSVESLPHDPLGELVRADLRSTLVHSDSLAVTRLGGIAVHFRQRHDGGGQSFGQTMLPYVERRFGRVPRLLEWCCGPGFIGFGLLGLGLTTHLGLADVNPDVLELCRTTIDRHDLQDKVSTYTSDCFDSIPAEHGWDLVVANPPHWLTHAAVYEGETSDAATSARREELYAERSPLIYLDPMWHTHRKFFSQLPSRLTAGGSAVLLEHSVGSSPEDFEGMIEGAGLVIVDVEPAEGIPFYFLHVRGA